MDLVRSNHIRLLVVLLLLLPALGLYSRTAIASATTPDDDIAATSYVPISSHTCVPDLLLHHSVLIYAYPYDKPNQQATEVPRIREQFAYAQDTLYAAAKHRNTSASYKIRCNAQLQPEVLVVQLPTASTADSFDTIKTDLRALGYHSNAALYWVDYTEFMQQNGKDVCGLGDLVQDNDQPDLSNPNNQGNRFAVSFKQPSTNGPCNVLQHEATHTMGAVQRSAPHHTSVPDAAGHCSDGAENDILCNGTQSCPGILPTQPNQPSPPKAFDCNNDDYFDPHPPVGSYLATHWNLGSCAQNWIELSSCSSKVGSITVDNTHPSISYTGSWTHQTAVPNTLGGTLSASSQINASASLTFVGTSITLFYSMGPTADRISVFIDGQSHGALQTRDPDIRRQVARTYDNLVTAPTHTILIIHSPTDGGSFSLDAFAINIAKVGPGSYDNTHAHLRYSGAWVHATSASGASNETISWSRDATNVVRFTFVGNTLRYVYDKAPNRGIALVTIDGIPRANIDQYYGTTVRPQQTTYNSLGPGIHVVTISPIGYTSGALTSPYITMDRFIVEP